MQGDRGRAAGSALRSSRPASTRPTARASAPTAARASSAASRSWPRSASAQRRADPDRRPRGRAGRAPRPRSSTCCRSRPSSAARPTCCARPRRTGHDRQHQEGPVHGALGHEGGGREGARQPATGGSCSPSAARPSATTTWSSTCARFPVHALVRLPGRLRRDAQRAEARRRSATAPAATRTSSTRWRPPGVAAGVDGLFIEVHENPARALSDGPNAYRLGRLRRAAVAAAAGAGAGTAPSPGATLRGLGGRRPDVDADGTAGPAGLAAARGPSRSSLLLRAWLAPPKGTAFVGTFYYVDDFYNYLSFVEQAQRGELVFQSKLALAQPRSRRSSTWSGCSSAGSPRSRRAPAPRLPRLRPARAVGRSSSGHRPPLVRALRACREDRRLAALLLVFTGGGARWAPRTALGLLPGERALDLRTGAFPFVEAARQSRTSSPARRCWPAALAGVRLRQRGGPGRAPRASLSRWSAPTTRRCSRRWKPSPRCLLATRVDRILRLSALLCLAPALGYQAWPASASPGFGAFSSSALRSARAHLPRAADRPRAGNLLAALGVRCRLADR